jgi:hypothetical protein
MVKGVFIEADHVEVAAMVLAMAFGTFLPAHGGGRMITLLLSNAARYFFMAGQALLIRDFFAQGMALSAIADPFQIGMRLGQGSGRELCLKTGKGAKRKAPNQGDMQ